ncbi:MAG TPA: hypothetical protein VH592_21110 [Gemmataceae bacterium]|jgi:hypothetical protein
MTGQGPKLTRRQEAAVAALLTAATLEDAARTAGVSVSTLRRWRQEPALRAACAEARAEMLGGTLTLLLKLNSRAVRTLSKCLKAPRASDQIRASNAILHQTVKATELVGLAEQVAELREKVQAIQASKRIRGVVG